MEKGRKVKKNIKAVEPNLEMVSLIMARISADGDENSVMKFTWTYANVLERNGNTVLMEAPEVGIKRQLHAIGESPTDDYIDGLLIEKNDDSVLLMSFTTMEFEDARDAIIDSAKKTIEEAMEAEEDFDVIKKAVQDSGELPS